MAEKITLSELPESLIKEAALVVANGMLEGPVYSHILDSIQDYEGKVNALSWLMEKNLYIRSRSSGTNICVIDEDGGEVVCFFMMVKEEEEKMGFFEKLPILSMIPFKFGIQALMRTLLVLSYWDEQHEKFLKPYLSSSKNGGYRLERFTVHPKFQKKGMGSKVLALVLEKADSEGRSVALSTQEKWLVDFYSRFGFRVVNEGQYKANGCEIMDFCMVRDAKSNGGSE